MSEEHFSTTRPVLLGTTPPPTEIPRPRGGSNDRAEFNNSEERKRNIDAQFDRAYSMLQEQVQLAKSIHDASDPQLVLVFEAIDEQIDLTSAANCIGLEILLEAEDAFEPTNDIKLKSEKAKNPSIKSCLHAVCANQDSFNSIRSIWQRWKDGNKAERGHTPLHKLFDKLKDVRPWGPQDRLQTVDSRAYYEGLIEGQEHFLDIELWYRQNPIKRTEHQREVSSLIQEAGGDVISIATIEQIGYHGMKCKVPTKTLKDLAFGKYDNLRLVNSTHVMYLHITGQNLSVACTPGATTSGAGQSPLPSGDPVLCLLDGVPASNHPWLRGRVEVFDPDGLEEMATVDERQHGTQMASVAVWGDRGRSSVAASRPVLVRPILTPAQDTQSHAEEPLKKELIPDLMRRVFRELFENNDRKPVGQSISIVNISVADPAAPFETIMSSWARVIDWLSYEYGVLIVVSAGNHPSLDFGPAGSSSFLQANGEDRRRALLERMKCTQSNHRLLAPAESINALTVGAIHDDASDAPSVAYRFDPTDGLPSISPISPIGSGYRRAIKPDLVANGGRVFCRDYPTGPNMINFEGKSAYGPGIKVATPPSKEIYIAGTSPAAALISRQAAHLHDLIDQITSGAPLKKRQRACAIKALLIHGTELPDEAECSPLMARNVYGNGVATRNLAAGCGDNEAVVLYTGSIGANEELELLFPLPNDLNIKEVKQIDATLAWLSPINWKHRDYRKAKLSFVKPSGDIPKLESAIGISASESTRGATTVQRQKWELRKAFASGQGSNMSVRVKCTEQAGGLGEERVDFAVVLSLWVAPGLGIDVYNQVRSQIGARVPIFPGE